MKISILGIISLAKKIVKASLLLLFLIFLGGLFTVQNITKKKTSSGDKAFKERVLKMQEALADAPSGGGTDSGGGTVPGY